MLKKLLHDMSSIDAMPIEVSEVASVLIENGTQDEIIFSGEDTDPEKVRGVFYQYTTSPGVYCSPDFVTLIVFSENVSQEWQRLICCKELVHVCDQLVERTSEPDEVSDLLDRLLGPLSSEDFGLADLMAAVERLAVYRGVALLFPDAARTAALEAIASDENITSSHIAKWVALPEPFVELALSNDWPEIVSSLFDE